MATTATDAPVMSGELAGLRILVIMPSVPVQGMERANLQIMRMLKERGADILCVTERDYGEHVVREVEQIGCRWTSMSCLTRLHLTKSPRQWWGMLRACWDSSRRIAHIIKDYRPTHIHVTSVLYFLLAWPALSRARQPVVFRLPNPPDLSLPAYKRFISNTVWRFCIAPVASALVCNSRFTLEQLRRTGARCRHASVIYNCLPERTSSVYDAPAVNRRRFNIVFLGRVRPMKGVDHLIEVALRMLREGLPVDFYIAGEDHWQNPFAAQLKQLVIEHQRQEHIHFLGHIQDVFGLLRQCDLHVLPTHSEAFGLVLLEAKSVSLPSVAYACGGVPEVVRHLEDGYVCRERSPQSLYEGIRHFLDNPQAMLHAKRAASMSLERFSIQRAADAWVKLYLGLQ